MNMIIVQCIENYIEVLENIVKRMSIYEASSLLYDICEQHQIADINSFPVMDFNAWLPAVLNEIFKAILNNEIDINIINSYLEYYDIRFSYHYEYDELIIKQNDKIICGVDISPFSPEEVGILIDE